MGAVHVRRQQTDAVAAAVGNIFSYLVRTVQNAGQQSGHILLGVVALEPGGLIGHHGVGHGVGLVEGVVGKVIDLVVDGLGHVLRDAVGGAALDVPGRIAVEERAPLLLDILDLLLAHGPSHHIRLTKRIARQLLEDLDDLLLVDDAAVGDVQNGLERRMLIGDQPGIVLAGYEPGYGFHGAGTVQRDNGGDVLNILRLQPQAHTGHAGGLHLEYTGGLALLQHLEHSRIVHGDL